MKIDSVETLLKVIEEKRAEKGISERELSQLIGKSAGLYWWIKSRSTALSFATVLSLLNALGLKLTVK
jgi:transcriptional regulator with XRE-family HTH domain